MNEIVISVIASLIAAMIIAIIRILFKKISNKKGFINKIYLEVTPFFKINSYIYLEKVNYLYGENATGKTALAEWISTLQDESRISRWLEEDESLPIIISIDFKYLSVSNIRIKIEKNGANYFVNNSKIAMNQIPYRIVFLEQKRISINDFDAIEYLSNHLSISTSQLLKLIEYFGTYPILSIKELKVSSKDPNNILVKLESGNKWMSFYKLSYSEQQRVIIEIGLLLCANFAKSNSTILIIEQSSFCIDNEYFKALIEKLASDEYLFQTFIISVEKPYFNNLNNVKTFVFSNKIPDIEIINI